MSTQIQNRQSFDFLTVLTPSSLQMDVTNKESILKVVEHVSKTDGKLDVLVNKCVPKL